MGFRLEKQKFTLIILILVCILILFCVPIDRVYAEDYVASSILDWLGQDDLDNGVHTVMVTGENGEIVIYSVHLYVYNEDQLISEDTVYGEAGDVATSSTYAQNMVAIKVKGNYTINENVVVRPFYNDYGGPKGFALFVTGTLTNNGVIDNSHGAKAVGDNVYLWKNIDNSYEYIPARGANGGGATSNCNGGGTGGRSGFAGIGRQTGGGGAAGCWGRSGACGGSGAGTPGTSYSGGTGGGGGDKGYGADGSLYGGQGGNASGSGGGAGGGAGNPGGYSVGNGSRGGFGTGGLLIISSNTFVNTSTGIIKANGTSGGGGNQTAGGSGGGSINIFYKESLTTEGNIQANGGGGYAGGEGTITYTQYDEITSISVNGKELENFYTNETDYEYELNDYDYEYEIYAVSRNEKTIKIDKTNIAFGETKNNSIEVTSEPGIKKVYNVTVTNPLVNDNNTKLKKIIINNGAYVLNDFFPSISDYYLDIYSKEISLDIDCIPFKDDVDVEISGNEYLNSSEGIIEIKVSLTGINSTIYRIHYKKVSEIKKINYIYTGNYQTFVAPTDAIYNIQLWGAQGGSFFREGMVDSGRSGGYGAYTSGDINLNGGQILYIYVGGKGQDGQYREKSLGGYNGGGSGDHDHGDNEGAGAGGGATDVRLISGNWNNFNSLKSRIMVAAGGGGSSDTLRGTAGGGLQSSAAGHADGATQTSGYAFGFGKNGEFKYENKDEAGGGGGYYGGSGLSTNSDYNSNGSGGSSYISGHYGSNSISEESTEDNIIHINNQTHYSSLEFTNTKMIDGDGYEWTDIKGSNSVKMPTHDGENLMVGNEGEGYAVISIRKALSHDNYLNELSIDHGTLSPTFDPFVQNYTIYLSKYDEKVTIDGKVLDEESIITGLDTYYLSNGETKNVDISIISTDGEIRTYNIEIKKDSFALGEHTSKLKSLDIERFEGTIDPEFHPLTTDYEIYIPSSIIDLNILYETFDEDATVTIENNDYLILNNSNIIVKVSAPNVADTIYTIKYIKATLEDDYTYETSTREQEFIAPITTDYKIELWGAEGGTGATSGTTYYGGKGSYTSGIITLKKNTKLYVNVGEKGSNHGYNTSSLSAGGYNGGGAGGDDASSSSDSDSGGGGGGATDISLLPSESVYDETKFVYKRSQASYASRIMVASGGGGGNWNTVNPGRGSNAGGLVIKGYGLYHGTTYYTVSDGTQTSGYAFGYAASGSLMQNGDAKGGGGGGYWTGINPSWGGQGAGGTSYISGHKGSIAVKSETDISPRLDENEQVCSSDNISQLCSVHYSGLQFKNTRMVDGSGYEWTTESSDTVVKSPTIDGLDEETGHSGNGYAKITPVLLNEDNYLSSIITDKGVLSPVFNPLIDEYTLTLDKYEEKFNLNATTSDEKAIVIGTGFYEMNSTNERTINIVVTSESGDSKTYTIHVIREQLQPGEHSSKLKTLTLYGISYIADLNPTFDPKIEKYSIDIFNDERNIKVKYTLYDSSAKVSIYGNVDLDENGTILIIVSAQGVSDTRYQINYSKNFTDISEYDYTGNYQTFVAPGTGDYKLELWGAEGGYNGGKGGYSKGIINLNKGDKIYVYVGGKGSEGNQTVLGGWNGGSNPQWYSSYSYGAGGGATDIRILPGEWNNEESLLSRIIVAGGGGGGHFENSRPSNSRGGAGGGAEGIKCSGSIAYGTEQCYGGSGGGWYNGTAGSGSTTGGHGGAGFVLTENNTENLPNGYTPTEKYYLTNSETIVGNQEVPTYNGEGTMSGNSNNGHAKITLIKKISDNNLILSLESSRGTLSPSFNPEIDEYTLNLTKYDEYFILSGELEDNYSSAKGFGKYVVKNGESEDIEITVTAENEETRTYLIHAIREDFAPGEHTSKLKKLEINGNGYAPDISPDFYPLVFEYGIDIANSEINLNIETETFDKEATVTIIGNDYFGELNGIIEIVVTESHVEDTVYIINYSKTFNDFDEYIYTGDYQTFVAPHSGKFKLELWGAEGGYNGGKGGYSKGIINLNKGDKIYVYVGGKGPEGNQTVLGGWNGGSNPEWYSSYSYGAGGGATDIRILPGEWNNEESLLSRIIVAGGGGGGHFENSRPSNSRGGAGGGAEGIKCSGSIAYGTEQCYGGSGGGWYNGTTGSGSTTGGHGGAGFVLTENNTENLPKRYIPTEKYYLTNSETIVGDQEVPTYNGEGTMSGNSNNGHAKITSVGEIVDKNNYLSSLSSSAGTLVPKFNPAITSYKLYTTSSDLDLIAVPDSRKAIVIGDGEIDVSTNKNITISVTAESGDERLYTVEIIDNASGNKNLTVFEPDVGVLSPNYDNEINDYNLVVSYSTILVNIHIETEDENALVEGNSNIVVDSNEKNISILVTAQDNTTRYINVKIIKNIAIEDIILQETNLVLIKGETSKINITTVPNGINLTYTYKYDDSGIISVLQNTITALNEGMVQVTISCEEDSNIEKIMNVYVVSDKIKSNIYDVADKTKEDESVDRIVIGAVEGTTIAEFKQNLLNPIEMINIYDSEGNLLSDTDIVKTGLVIKLENNSVVYDEAILIVRGDIDQDGIIDVTDESILADHILEIKEITGYGIYAADIEEDDILDVSDDSTLSDYILMIIDSLN